MIDFDYAAPETWGSRILGLQMRAEPHKIGGVVYVPEQSTTLGGEECENLAYYPLINFECSVCGCEVCGGDELGANIQQGRWNFCPNCGKAVKR